jgi:hypothetical protein
MSTFGGKADGPLNIRIERFGGAELSLLYFAKIGSEDFYGQTFVERFCLLLA